MAGSGGVGKRDHGLGPSTYLPGNVSHLVSPIVGMLRLMERDGEAPDPEDMAYMIDRLAFVLEIAREADEEEEPVPSEVAEALLQHAGRVKDLRSRSSLLAASRIVDQLQVRAAVAEGRVAELEQVRG